ncbi:MAG: hypothetical protein ACON3Z_06780 [Bradymonadia bacterium]
MSYQIYKIIHVVGLAMIMLGLGGLMFHALGGGEKKHDGRRGMMMTHGGGLFLVILGGFGMLARKGIHWPWPGWVTLKFGLWVGLGVVTLLLYRNQTLNRLVYILALIMAGLAVGAVQYQHAF